MRVNLNLQNFAQANSVSGNLHCNPSKPCKAVSADVPDLPPCPNLAPNYFANISFGKIGGEKGEDFSKEMREQPEVIRELLRKYFSSSSNISNVNHGLDKKALDNLGNIYLVASGSSRHAAMVATPFITHGTRSQVISDYASEAAHKRQVNKPDDFAVFISQSGTTGDVNQVYDLMKGVEGFKGFALTNDTEGEKNIYNKLENHGAISAGKENAVAATKSVTASIINLMALGLKLGFDKGTLGPKDIGLFSDQLRKIPDNLEAMFNDEQSIEQTAAAAKALAEATKGDNGTDAICILGRGANYAAALEGSLKLNETTYRKAAPYAAGEFMHGPIATMDENYPVIALLTGEEGDENYDIAVNNLEAVMNPKNEGEPIPKTVVIFKDKDNEALKEKFPNALFIDTPNTPMEPVSAIYNIVRFQMLAEQLCKIEDKDPDAPRRLSKAVSQVN